MKMVRKTYIKPETHDVRIGEEALCDNINIGISSSCQNEPGSMGAKANSDFDDEMEEINDMNYKEYNDYTGFSR